MKKASKILFVDSIIIYAIVFFTFASLWIDYHENYLNSNGDDKYKLALVPILVFIFTLGLFGNGVSLLFSIIGYILYHKANGENKKFICAQIAFIILPIVSEIAIFLSFYLHP